jgi:hypothetical protein
LYSFTLLTLQNPLPYLSHPCYVEVSVVEMSLSSLDIDIIEDEVIELLQQSIMQ